MEYLEGETLSDRLGKGSLPLEQVLRFGVEIADALDKAHRQGIVHRDLKPGNVMLTKSGVKLLDFGLAKAMAPAAALGRASLTTFMSKGGEDLTAEGTILGTFQYMAPEQLEGREADARTDIFAFGACCTRWRRAEGVHGRQPGVADRGDHERASRRRSRPCCRRRRRRSTASSKRLAKDPDDRWQTARDLGSELSGSRRQARRVLSPLPPFLGGAAGCLADIGRHARARGG